MNRIIKKTQLSEEVYRFDLRCPDIVRERRPGQFVIVQQDTEYGERIPLTIADADRERETITIIFQTVGSSTHRLALLEEGDSVENVLGPLGTPTHIENFGNIICVGGGIGVAPLHPIVKGMKDAGNRVDVIIGARSENLLILEEEMRSTADTLTICTDDGSAGLKALVTEPLADACRDNPPDLMVAIGPPIMMKFCVKTAAEFNIPIMVSLNSIMVDGTGMCGGCRVTIGGETKFVCVDGPEFDGHQVDFDSLMLRLGAYREREDDDHEQCHLDNDIEVLKSGKDK